MQSSQNLPGEVGLPPFPSHKSRNEAYRLRLPARSHRPGRRGSPGLGARRPKQLLQNTQPKFKRSAAPRRQLDVALPPWLLSLWCSLNSSHKPSGKMSKQKSHKISSNITQGLSQANLVTKSFLSEIFSLILFHCRSFLHPSNSYIFLSNTNLSLLHEKDIQYPLFLEHDSTEKSIHVPALPCCSGIKQGMYQCPGERRGLQGRIPSWKPPSSPRTRDRPLQTW